MEVHCSADAALRRAIPAVNEEVRRVQGALEDVAFKLRIPQRKPWPAMADDVTAAAKVVGQRDKARASPLPPPLDLPLCTAALTITCPITPCMLESCPCIVVHK